MNLNYKVGAIIVTYFPDYEKLIGLLSCLDNLDVIYIVDNGSSLNIESLLNKFSSKIVFIELIDNFGIAFAQNLAIQQAKIDDVRRIIFFDQDSLLNNNFVHDIVSEMDNHQYDICSPSYFNEKLGFEYNVVDINRLGFRRKFKPSLSSRNFPVSVAISSGMLVDMTVFDKVGLMDESLFIDYVDTEWCLRCFNHGILVHICPKIKMHHSIGDETLKLFKFDVPIHSPLRRFYRVRNSFKLIHYKHVPKLMVIREIIFSILHTLVIAGFKKGKYNYFKFLVLAIISGLKNESGKL